MKTDNHNKPRKKKRPYVDWFTELIEQYSKRHRKSHESLERYCSRKAYFVTLTFNRKRLHERIAEIGRHDLDYADVAFVNLDRLYKEICRRTIGKGWYRQKHHEKQPLAIAALDFEGTRSAEGELAEERNPHLHMLLVLPEGCTVKIEDFQQTYRWRKFLDRLDADSVRITRFNPQRCSVRRLVTYIQKYLELRNAIRRSNLPFRIYPRDNLNPDFRRPEALKLRRRSWMLEKMVKAVRKEKAWWARRKDYEAENRAPVLRRQLVDEVLR